MKSEYPTTIDGLIPCKMAEMNASSYDDDARSGDGGGDGGGDGALTDDDFVLGPPPEHVEVLLAPTGWRAIPRYLGVIAFLAIVIFWIWAFNNRDSVAHPDEFDDPAFVQTAEAICSARQATISSFPLATAASGPIERGLLIERGTAELVLMVAELNQIDLPADPVAAAGVQQWLVDYELYISDRRAYSTVLSQDRDEAFLLTANANGDRVTDALRTFAEVNQMFSCVPSGDA